jgi:ABC-2 type transport system permease protein
MYTTLTTIRALWKREIIKFIRDRSRLVGALAQPLGFWLLLGLGFYSSFQMPGQNQQSISFLEYLYPGIIALILLFTSIFSTISVITDRQEGFLQSVLVAPVSRTAIVLGNLLGTTTLALGEALLFLLLAPLVGLSLTIAGVVLLIIAGGFLAVGFTALGFLFAWRRDTVRGFHAIMNLILFPLWILSGAFFPAAGAPQFVQWIMTINPVTYGMTAIRYALYWPSPPPEATVSIGVAFAVTALFALIMVTAAIHLVRQPLYGKG